MAGKVQCPRGASVGNYLCDVQHCSMHKGVFFFLFAHQKHTKHMKCVCETSETYEGVHGINRTGWHSYCAHQPQLYRTLSLETPLQPQLCYQLAILSWPSHLLCLVDLTQAGYETAAKKVFIRKCGSEGNI